MFRFARPALYAAPLLGLANEMSNAWIKALAGAGWVGSLASSLLFPKPGEPRNLLGRVGANALDIAASVVVIGIFFGVAAATSLTLVHLEGGGTTAVPEPSKHAASQSKSDAATGTMSKEVGFDKETFRARLEQHVIASFTDQDRVLAHSVQLASKCGQDNVDRPVFCVVEWAVPDEIDLTLAVTLACFGTFLLFGWRVDVNTFSLHNLYKNRLIRCYLGASRQEHRHAHPFTGFDEDDDLPLAKLRVKPAAGRENGKDKRAGRPLHIVNAALNITQGTSLAWQERKAASFTFTPLHCGYALGASTGDIEPLVASGNTGPSDSARAARERVGVEAYRDSKYYASERGEGRMLTLGTAMATSGAAVSPNMGRATTAALGFVLTVFNVRLARWMPNPRREKWRQAGPGFGLVCLLQELFGFSNERRTFVHLSDGGHFDNTGIYELVRRKCRTIIAVDAGADLSREFDDLANVIRRCRVDFGVRIELGLGKLGTTRAEEAAASGYVVGDLDYGDGAVGRIIVIKPTLLAHGRLGVDVFSYAKGHQEFPQQSTVDQFFDGRQFESYRVLGERIGTACLEDQESRLALPG